MAQRARKRNGNSRHRIGSLTSKAVIAANGKVIALKLVLTGSSAYEAAAKAVEGAMTLAAVDTKHVAGFVSTGGG